VKQTRETNLNLTAHEIKVLEEEDLEEDAFFVFDQNENLINVEIARPVEDNTQKFKRLFVDRATNIEDPRMGLIDSSEDGRDQTFQFNIFQFNIQSSRSLKVDDEGSEVLDQETPKMSAREKHENDAKVRIDPSQNLGSLVINEYVEEEDLTRKTDKNGILGESGLMMSIKETKVKIVWSMLKLKKFFVKGIENEKSFREMNIIDKLFFIFLDAPFDFLRRISIPPGSLDQWNRRFAIICPVFAVLWIFFVTKIYDFASAPPIAFYV